MPEPSLAVVMVEDHIHQMLIYRYLCHCGLSSRQIRIVSSPSGRGSAEQWVRRAYAAQVKAYRLRATKAATALIVMIDADTKTVHARLEQLKGGLMDEGSPPVGDNERIARLVPKRNVETWILNLTEQAANEIDDYKGTGHGWNSLIREASENLFKWSRPAIALPNQCVDSLRRGMNELIRLQF